MYLAAKPWWIRADQRGAFMSIGYKTMPPQPPDYGTGPAVLEFGVDWCSHCRGAQKDIGAVLGGVPGLAHYRIEDGPGRPLGRAFKIKRWPTLVFLHDGREVERLVRPDGAEPIRQALDKTLHPSPPDPLAAKP